MLHRAKTPSKLILLAAALALAACGRAGAPTAVDPAAPEAEQQEAAPVQDRPFVLDPLLN